ncbi:MAG: hypothetical protein U0T82_07755 [Bacteroidales bacterium]
MIEKPYNGRAQINYDGVRMRITIPSKKNWFAILFSAAWMGGWFMGESFAINEVASLNNAGTDAFLLFWLVGWTIGGIFVFTFLLYSLFGQETIVIERDVFSVSKGILDLGLIKKNYDVRSIKNLELNPDPGGMNTLFGEKKNAGEFWGLTGGKIRFDYGMKTVKLGVGIDEAEARYMIEEIKKHGFYKGA